jgi:hypothetical protein
MREKIRVNWLRGPITPRRRRFDASKILRKRAEKFKGVGSP